MEPRTLKQIIKLITLTLIISYCIDKIVFFSLNKVSDMVMSGQTIGKLNQFLSIKDSSDFIIFGNSRAYHHIDTSIFGKKAFNMGVDGTRIAYSSTLINTLPEDKDQVLIVHLDTKDFLDKNYDGSDIKGLKTKFSRNDKITNALIDSGQIPTLQKFFYSINYNGSAIGIIKNFIKPKYNYRTYNGYDPIFVAESQESMRDSILANKNTSGCEEDYIINPLAIKYLNKIKSFSEKNHKKLIIITSPIYDDLCEVDNKILEKIMRDQDLTYWNFTNLYKNTQNKAYWKDGTHMSHKGAEAFSKHLYSKYISLYQ